MSEQRNIAADRAVCEKATKPPWKSRRNREGYRYIEFDSGGYDTSPLLPQDADFIALARTALPHYIDRAEAAEKRLKQIEELLYPGTLLKNRDLSELLDTVLKAYQIARGEE